MPPTESTSLLPTSSADESSSVKDLTPAAASMTTISHIFIVIQVVVLAIFATGTTYSSKDYEVKEYIAFRDIMAMLLLGFGYLMTFLKNYGLGAVGMTMMLSIVSMELNILVEWAVRYLYGSKDEDTAWPLPIGMPTMIDSEFAAATLMISFGAIIGRASPLQLLFIAISQSVWYSVNKVMFVLGSIGAEDVGGSMTIHMFGAYFGLAVSAAMGPPVDPGAEEAALPDKVSDILALIGTTILWVFWPSFVGATETGILENEHHCIVNTILSLMASTTMTFYLSQTLGHGRWDPVHVANSTLAGGVAIGSAGRLNIGPGAAILTGMLSGAVSVCGYQFSSPYLADRFGIHDTCGVGNLHGYPSLVGALLSVAFIGLDPAADFLAYGMVEQMFRQLGGIASTLFIAVITGYGTGYLVKGLQNKTTTTSFADSVWWHLEY